MKRIFMVLFALFFCGFPAFAETSNNDLGISDAVVKGLIEEYLGKIFNRYLLRPDLRVTELSCTTDWERSANDKNLNYYNTQARFRNFPIKTASANRILSGRLETTIAVRKNSGAILGFGGKPGIDDKDNKELNITLLVDDQLSDELRDATVRNYMTKNYEHPVGIQINKERLEVYADKIYSYVSGIVNNDSIVYLRAIFEKQPPRIEQLGPFTIKETPWELNRAEEIFNKLFPSRSMYTVDIQGDIFDPVCGFYARTNGRKSFIGDTSKILSIPRVELKEANDGMIKLELELLYELDFWGGPGSTQQYTVIAFALYQFNFEKEIWEYKGIENIDNNNITAVNRR